MATPALTRRYTIDDLDRFPDDGRLRELVDGRVVEWEVPNSATVPDLVIEILSPSDRALDVQEKIRDWLRAGVKLLWYVNPETGAATIYQGDRMLHVDADDALTGADVLPGFTLRLRAVLDELAALEAGE